MKRFFTALRLSATVAIVCILAACDSNFINTQEELTQNSNKSQEIYNKTKEIDSKHSLIEHTDSYKVANESFHIAKPNVLPPVFNQKMIYSSASEEALPTILSDLYAQTGVKFKFSPDAIAYMSGDTSGGFAPQTQSGNAGGSTEKGTGATGLETAAIEIGGSEIVSSVGVLNKVQLNLQFTGTLKSLIERFASGFNIYWEYDEDKKTVQFFRTQTKVLALDVLPGQTTFTNEMTSSSEIGGSGAGSTSANLNSGAVMDVKYEQTEYNTWKDTVTTVQNMLSREGRVTPNPRAGFVTVTDIPERLARIEDFINKINDKARRKIAVKVDVFDVLLSNKTDYGINWDLVVDALGSEVTINSLIGGNSPLSNFATPIDTLVYTHTGGGALSTSNAIFSALSQQGDTSTVTGTTVYTVNGEPAPVQVVTRTDYIKEITFSALTVDAQSTQVAVTPGTVVTGFFMVVTPTILSDNQILLNLSLSLSTADTTGPSRTAVICAPGTTQTATTPCPSITLPEVKSKNFMESVTLNPGQSVILSGFQELDNDVGVESVAAPSFWMFGGSKATNTQKATTVTVITPYVVGR